MMGLSFTSAIIGLAIVILGVVLLVIRKQRNFAIACLIVGFLLIFVPYTVIYVFFD
jgi:hypothetical protein